MAAWLATIVLVLALAVAFVVAMRSAKRDRRDGY